MNQAPTAHGSPPALEPLDPLAADFRPLSELLARLPRRPSPPVVCRWIYKGVCGTRLRVLKIAGRNHTTEREFRRFIGAMQTVAPAPTDADHEAAERELKRRGYL